MKNNSDIKAIEELTNILFKIVEAGEEKNLTEENKKIAIEDTFKLLNRSMQVIVDTQEMKRLNAYQNIYFKAINNVNKKVKFPLIKLNNNLWRVYIMSLFKAKKLDLNILKNITTWDANNLEKEKISYDMKLILLSMLHLDDKEEDKEENAKDNN